VPDEGESGDVGFPCFMFGRVPRGWIDWIDWIGWIGWIGWVGWVGCGVVEGGLQLSYLC